MPSIHSQEEQFMISQFLASVNVKNGSEIWLGGRQMDFHNFNWADGSMFNYSYWEQGEPNFPAEKCIEMSWRNGRWNDINCRLKRAVLCERQVASRHQLTKPNLYQPTICLDSNCTSQMTTTAVTGQPPGLLDTSTAQQQQSPGQYPAGEPAVVSLSTSGNNTASFLEVPAAAYSTTTTTSREISNQSLAASLNSSGGGGGSSSLIEAIYIEDKPIKVITSIMDRPTEQSVGDPLAPLHNSSMGDLVAATIGTTNNGTFVHYNLPPPGSNSAPDPINQDSQAHESLYSSEPVLPAGGLKKDPEPSKADTSAPAPAQASPSTSPLTDLIQKVTLAATSKPIIENPPDLQSADQAPPKSQHATGPAAIANNASMPATAATSNSPLAVSQK